MSAGTAESVDSAERQPAPSGPASRSGILILTGPSGVGKSAAGERVAARLGVAFVDADELHDERARAKMARGEALEEADRGPWLTRVAQRVEQAARCGETLVLACSALAVAHRARLRAAAGGAPCLCVGLRAPEAVLRARVSSRRGHFFPAELVASQLAALEPGSPDEPLVPIDAQGSLEDVVLAILEAWERRRA